MATLKYTFLILITTLFYTAASAQCTVPSSNPNKFEVIKAAKEQNVDNGRIKYLTGGVVFLINDYEVHADSAVVFIGTNNFEAYGNVSLVKKDTKVISGSSAFYREDLHYINFMHNVISYYEDQPAITKSKLSYDVSQ